MSIVDLHRGAEGLTEENLVELWHDAGWYGFSDKYPDKLLKAMQNSSYLVTAWKEDRLVGLCACMSNGMQVYVSQLAVIREFQGIGIGSMLIKDVVLHFNDQEIILMTVNAEDFYVKNGFSKDKVHKVVSLDNRKPYEKVKEDV